MCQHVDLRVKGTFAMGLRPLKELLGTIRASQSLLGLVRQRVLGATGNVWGTEGNITPYSLSDQGCNFSEGAPFSKCELANHLKTKLAQ